MNKGMRYAIIFTDFAMPIMNGIDSTKIMRKYLTEECQLPKDK